MRIGTNHGSLSDRIMNRYGDTPLGMCESALEFARLARENDYHQFVFSMKASNPKVMIEAYRLLVARLAAEGPDWNYPIHLGVTEAGDGEDGRIKSAIGIGSLLADGIGDTIRVSLTEDAIYEIPVAQALVAPYNTCRAIDAGCCVSRQGKAIADDANTTRINWDLVKKSEATFLPHWTQDNATYAVTFRLADSLTTAALESYRNKQQAFTEPSLKESVIRKQLAEIQQTEIDPELDLSHGSCLFKTDAYAQLVADAMAHFDGKRYTLMAWCIMPNHVHVVLKLMEGELLEKVLHSWKSFTAHDINKALGQSGTIWQKESYNHLVTDDEDLRNQVTYLLDNPGKAGLNEWKWVWCRPSEFPEKRGLLRDAATTIPPSYDPFSYDRRRSLPLTVMGHELGGDKTVRVLTTQERWNTIAHKIAGMGDFKPEIILEKAGVIEIDPRDLAAVSLLNAELQPRLVTVKDGLDLQVIHAFRELAFRVDPRHPILLKDTLHPPSGETDFITALLPAAQNIGSLLCDGIGDAILVRGETAPGQSLRLAYNILQAAGTRIFKTDYVACPSCGRTLFNLQSTTQKIRAATGHLKGVRIAIMGCIVNGPGEMADADFGYVGGAPNKINLYVGKTAVKFNIPETEAVERLTELIREHGKWQDAPEPATVEV
jgi:1-hydroxy-2-methyl-2-(E)-butenyl 4-diphosphate synthase